MTIEYESPYWNHHMPPPPGFTPNPWEAHGSQGGPWNWDSYSSPWNWDGQRPVSSWNWENHGPPPPWGPYNFPSNAYPPPFPGGMPFFHQPPSYPHSQGFSPIYHSGSSASPPSQEGLVPPPPFSSTPPGSGSSISGGSWPEHPSDVGEGNLTGGTMQMPLPASGKGAYRAPPPPPGITPIPHQQSPRWQSPQSIGRGSAGAFIFPQQAPIPRGVGKGLRPAGIAAYSGTATTIAASIMSHYYTNPGLPASCGPSTDAIFPPAGFEMEDESSAHLTRILPCVNPELTGVQMADRLEPGVTPEKGQGETIISGYRILKNTSVTHILCSICCKKNGRLCTGCGHVAYCGKKCQQADWEKHKYVCMPASGADKKIVLSQTEIEMKLESGDENNFKYNGKVMARRKINKGEHVLQLQPIMMACNDKGMIHPPDSVLCLSCCKWYQSSQGYRCASCRWPVCSVQCEKNPLHANYECTVFSSQKLVPPPQSDHTQFFDDVVLALRCLLLKNVDPPKFEELFEWKDICTKKNRTSTWAEYDQRIVTFLTEKCQVHELLNIKPEELIDYLKVIDVCSLMVGDRVVISASEFGKSFFCAKYVLPSKMLVTEECSPNCKWSMKHSSNLEDCSLRLHSALSIEPGSYITASFSNASDFGASFPRRYNSLRFDSVCDCRRCKDPTELGSFFSGVKCQECESEADGFLLPTNPADPSSEWECHNSKCKKRMKGSFIIQDINRIHNEMLDAGNDYWALVDLIWKYERRRLHPNHFLILKAATICVELFWGSVRGMPFYSPRYEFFSSCINLANRAITILDIISPGASIQRARILFQIQVAYAYKNLRDFRRYLEWGEGEEKKCIPRVFWEIQKIQEEAYEVLITEPYGSLEHELSVVLQEVIEDQVDLLSLTPTEVPLEYTSVYNLHKIYSRFSNEFYYPAIPIYEDKDIHEFVISTGPCARHLVEKINYTI